MPTPAAAPTRPEVTDFADALEDFMRAVRRAHSRFAPSEEHELSPAQFHLLDPLLTAAGPVPLALGALAEAAGVSAPTATRMLDGLERHGYVERVRCADDRRIVRVGLTDEGIARVERRRTEKAVRHAEMFDSLAPSEQRNAARVLAQLATAVEEMR